MHGDLRRLLPDGDLRLRLLDLQRGGDLGTGGSGLLGGLLLSVARRLLAGLRLLLVLRRLLGARRGLLALPRLLVAGLCLLLALRRLLRPGLRLLALARLLLILSARLLVTTLRLLLVLLCARRRLLSAGLRRQAAALLERLHQVLELGDHAHAARAVAGVGERARALDDLLDVALALPGELGLADPLLDPVELRAAVAALLSHGRPRCHQREAGPGQQCSSQAFRQHRHAPCGNFPPHPVALAG